MCEFVSWVEHENKLYYLTANLLNTKEGRALKKYLGAKYYEDIQGHGAIERYFGIKGNHHEFDDFSSPKNFPKEIVEAMKAGAFRGIGIPDASLVLTKKAYADYQSKRDALYADYQSKRAPLDADYESKCAPLYADYESKRASLYADYLSKRAPLDADYLSKRAPLDADYESKCAPLYADYLSKRDALYADYESKRASLDADYLPKRDALYADYLSKRDDLFWDIFMDKKNRAKAWK
jgi:hypothetical protein